MIMTKQQFAAAVSAALAVATIACSGPATSPAPAVESAVFESGVARPGAEATSRAELPGAEWLTAFRAEAVAPGAGGWMTDLRLANGTRLVAASDRLPELRFPAGFALPLGQILRDIPAAWRELRTVAAVTAGSGPETGARLRTRVEFVRDTAAELKRLYVLELALTAEAGDRWTVPPGGRAVETTFTTMAPLDATVHAAYLHAGALATRVRFEDTADGKVLWDGEAGATLPSYASDKGFPVFRERAYRVRVEFGNPGPETAEGWAVLFLYYRPPRNATLSYPLPPP
jgi:hypothetical protein